MSFGNDYLAPIAAKLTWNGAVNLRQSVSDPCPFNPESIHGRGRLYTGLGKWTTLAAIGVENSIISLGLAERRGEHGFALITPLGREVARYVHDHWENMEFREPKGRK